MLPPPVDLPNLRPSESVTSGAVSACTVAPSTRRISSTPPTMLPHWSEPPIWSRQPSPAEQVQVVLALQQQVAELGVGHALGGQPPLDRLAGQHDVDREVLADVAQELQHRLRAGPVEVVGDHARRSASRRTRRTAPAGRGCGRTQSATVSVLCRVRSPTSRGSPICPVAPPASTIGRAPACWKRRSVSSGMRCPACRLGAGRVEPAVEREHARRRGRAAARRGPWSGRSGRATPARPGCRCRPSSPGRRRSRCSRRRSSPTGPGLVPAPRPGRYGLTAGESASQNRHGVSCAAATPTRGPGAHRRRVHGRPGEHPHRRARVGHVEPVVRAVQPEQRRQPGRTAGEVGGPARRGAPGEGGGRGPRSPRRRAAAPRPPRRRSGRSRWRRSACRRRSRRRGARAARTSPRCAAVRPRKECDAGSSAPR